MKYLGWIVAGVCAIILLVVSLRPRKVEVKEVEVVKTIVKVDSIYIKEPILVKTTEVDTIRVGVPVKETIIVKDTIYVLLSREEKIYEDSLYRAQISGYDPSLDWINIYPRTMTKYVEVPKKPQRWGVGVQGGFGVGPNGVQPYIGLGVSYNLWTW